MVIKMQKKFLFVLLILALTVIPSVSAIRPNYIYDNAGVIDVSWKTKINDFGRSVDTATTAEIVIVTLTKLNGTTIEQTKLEYFNNIVFDGIKGIGKAGKDNGVLIVLVMDSHDIAIETGYGVEGQLPDAECGRIIRDTMTPEFKNGNFGNGLYLGMVAVGKDLGFDNTNTTSTVSGNTTTTVVNNTTTSVIGSTTTDATNTGSGTGITVNSNTLLAVGGVVIVLIIILVVVSRSNNDDDDDSFSTGSHSSRRSGVSSDENGKIRHLHIPTPLPVALVGVAAFLAGEKKLTDFTPTGNQVCPKCGKETPYYKDNEYTSQDVRGDGVFDVITTSCLCLVCGNVYATSLDKLIMSHAEYVRQKAEEAEKEAQEESERERRRKQQEEDSARRHREDDEERSSYHSSPSSSPSSFGGGHSGGGGAVGKW